MDGKLRELLLQWVIVTALSFQRLTCASAQHVAPSGELAKRTPNCVLVAAICIAVAPCSDPGLSN
jgi:hypothetical protein